MGGSATTLGKRLAGNLIRRARRPIKIQAQKHYPQLKRQQDAAKYDVPDNGGHDSNFL